MASRNSHNRRYSSSPESEDSDRHSKVLKKKHSSHENREKDDGHRWSDPESDDSENRHHHHHHHHKKEKRRHRHQEPDSGSENDEQRRHKSKHRNKHQIKVKQEPISDEESDDQRHGHSRHRHSHHVRVKQEPLSDEEQGHNRERDRHNRNREKDRHRKREHMSSRNSENFGKKVKKEDEKKEDKDKPDFELSGKLTEDTNTFRGVVIKYNQPPEARKPRKKWRLYPFKGEEGLPVLHLHRQSAYLMGRDRKIADIPVDHPSCSKQHAVLQFRLCPYEREDGAKGMRVRPYVIDLGSTNGTYINNERVEAQKYYELKEKDVLKFGFSSREYVMLHDKSDISEVAGEDEGLSD